MPIEQATCLLVALIKLERMPAFIYGKQFCEIKHPDPVSVRYAEHMKPLTLSLPIKSALFPGSCVGVHTVRACAKFPIIVYLLKGHTSELYCLWWWRSNKGNKFFVYRNHPCVCSFQVNTTARDWSNLSLWSSPVDCFEQSNAGSYRQSDSFWLQNYPKVVCGRLFHAGEVGMSLV